MPTPPRSIHASLLPAVAVLVGIFVVGGCGGDRLTPQAAFENLEVRIVALDGRDVRLRERRADFPDEAVSILLDDLHLTGTLDHPDRPVTSGILYATREGAGVSTELVVARQEGESPMVHVASFPLGGRMRIEGIRYQDETIVVHTLEYAAEDPPCCPTRSSQRRFRLLADALTEIPGAEGT